MQLLAIFSLVSAAMAGTAILQFEIDQDTFTSNTEISVPGSLTINKQLIAATVAETDGIADPSTVSCQAFDGTTKVGVPFNTSQFTTFANRQLTFIESITCSD
jgi:hypothetical protein